MKITNLKIKKLYGYINYDISFYDNINFLYGENGCGKTTVLNIITNIITGKVYNLCKYQFQFIDLKCIDSSSLYDVTINMIDKSLILKITDKDKEVPINEININNEFENEEEKHRYYFSAYPILDELRSKFNYVFLPLNRDGDYMNNSMLYRRNRNWYMRRYDDYKYFESNNINIQNVNFLIKDAINRKNLKLNNINETFNKYILKSFLDAENIANSNEIIDYLHDIIVTKAVNLENIKTQYKNVLRSIDLLDTHSEKKIQEFFDDLYKYIADYRLGNEETLIDLTLKLSELKKITDIISKAEENDRLKSKVTAPITNFTKTINLFFRGNFNEKQLQIHPDGRISFKNRFGKHITLQDLSSGEKQIFTFFAYLIFCIDHTKQSMYLVDEPELSLHLNWQRIFVKSIMDLNMDIQLIFATHAPEIIGKYREYAVKLEPTVEEKKYE
jgi:predicted ATPase